MNLEEYTVTNTGDYTGELTLIVSHDGTEYSLDFTFEERGTAPNEHSPFPSSDTEIYAWPTDDIPEEIRFEAGTDEAAVLVFGIGLPEDINLLDRPYDQVDETGSRSPFVKYPDD